MEYRDIAPIRFLSGTSTSSKAELSISLDQLVRMPMRLARGTDLVPFSLRFDTNKLDRANESTRAGGVSDEPFSLAMHTTEESLN